MGTGCRLPLADAGAAGHTHQAGSEDGTCGRAAVQRKCGPEEQLVCRGHEYRGKGPKLVWEPMGHQGLRSSRNTVRGGRWGPPPCPED